MNIFIVFIYILIRIIVRLYININIYSYYIVFETMIRIVNGLCMIVSCELL